MRTVLICLALVALTGCATSRDVIVGYNTVKNAQKLTGAGVRAELNQQAVNVLRNYNKSRGGF